MEDLEVSRLVSAPKRPGHHMVDMMCPLHQGRDLFLAGGANPALVLGDVLNEFGWPKTAAPNWVKPAHKRNELLKKRSGFEQDLPMLRDDACT